MMLFLITPSGVQSNNLTSSTVQSVGKKSAQGIDLAGLDWQPSDVAINDTLVALALRYGVKCTSGIVLDGGHVGMALHPAQVASTQAAAQHSQDALRVSQGPLMEALLPGWEAHGRETDAGVAASAQQVIAEGQAKIDRAIADRDVDPALTAHWFALGGTLPPSA